MRRKKHVIARSAATRQSPDRARGPARLKKALLFTAALALVSGSVLTLVTLRALPPTPTSLPPAEPGALHFTARDGTPLNRSFTGRFNDNARLPLWQVPELIKKAFIESEDRHYRAHGGVDWRARFAALWGNLRAGHVQRGASTIGEQAARILHPRPRSYWGHWTAGFEASRLLQRFGHETVLQFYLNQVPYGAQRRGIQPAARYYFGRDPGALSPAEQLALAVLVRSPSRYNPRQHQEALRQAVNQLAGRMRRDGVIQQAEYHAIQRAPIIPAATSHANQLTVNAGPFVVYARQRAQALGLHGSSLRTTLDPTLQRFVQNMLRTRLAALSARGAQNGAALVVDNLSGAVLAWAVAPKGKAFDIDPVHSPRQPGSTLKPFVYALAMTRLGWQPDTVIEDASLAETVGAGVHSYRNYSGRYYGRVSLRYALANSLNIPAVKTAQAVGMQPILKLLHGLGFSTFTQSADYYGPAIVLGDGAVTLFDLVQGYATLARRGQFIPLRVLEQAPQPPAKPVLSPAVTSLLANILSDPAARAAEFGTNSVLNLPYPTAVKTGTSSDYRDAWTVGFDNHYTVGIWMGRLGGGSTQQLTGSTGPALVLRQIFAQLRSAAPYPGLWHSPKLIATTRCEWIGGNACSPRPDWRLPGQIKQTPASQRIAFARPLPGETLAIDPRIANNAQRYRFAINIGTATINKIIWRVDGQEIATTKVPQLDWSLVLGKHQVSAHIWMDEQAQPQMLDPVSFSVLTFSVEAPISPTPPRGRTLQRPE